MELWNASFDRLLKPDIPEESCDVAASVARHAAIHAQCRFGTLIREIIKCMNAHGLSLARCYGLMSLLRKCIAACPSTKKGSFVGSRYHTVSESVMANMDCEGQSLHVKEELIDGQI